MTPPLSFRFLLPLVLSALASAVAAGCGGTTADGSSTGGVKPGDPCTTGAPPAGAEDGCNTCTCSAGAWACTERACLATDGGPGSVCQTGTTSSDGCNQCTCVDGQFACTDRACPPVACKEGDTKQESCNTCTCMNGAWGCTKKACIPPDQCKTGESKFDGCNNCSCESGHWSCTLRFCPPPAMDAGTAQKGCGGWLGDTCSPAEYCAYEEGQMCGAADASAHCAPRPSACDAIYQPVCGCDGKTYGNTCDAAMARTGVLKSGPCAVDG